MFTMDTRTGEEPSHHREDRLGAKSGAEQNPNPTVLGRSIDENYQAYWLKFKRWGPYWKEHVTKTHEILTRAAAGLTGTAILIGASTIEPLEALAKQFDEVVLIDVSQSNMENVKQSIPEGAVDAKGIRLHSKLKTRALDITGGRINALLEAGLQKIEAANTPREAVEQVAAWYRTWDMSFNASYFAGLEGNLVVTSGVSSQLLTGVDDAFEQAMINQFKITSDANVASDIGFNMNDQTLYEKFGLPIHIHKNLRRSRVTLFKNIIVNHFQVLNQLTRAGGRLYHADTVSTTPILDVLSDNQRKRVMNELASTIREKNVTSTITDQGILDIFKLLKDQYPDIDMPLHRIRSRFSKDDLDEDQTSAFVHAMLHLISSDHWRLSIDEELIILNALVRIAESVQPDVAKPTYIDVLTYKPHHFHVIGERETWLWISNPRATALGLRNAAFHYWGYVFQKQGV